MSRISSVCWIFFSLAFSDAERITSHVESGIPAHYKNPFSPTCETLHTRFQARANNLQDFVSSYKASDAVGTIARARSVMKATAVLRTLRRAADCPWVVNGNSDDLEAISKMVRTTLSSNPCAKTAIRELGLVDSVGDDSQVPMVKAMCILMSDTCECKTQAPDEVEEGSFDVDQVETEEAVQDMVEDMIDSSDAPSSLVENSKHQSTIKWESVGKLIGAIMLGVLFSLGCGYAGAMIVWFVGWIFTSVLLKLNFWLGLIAYELFPIAILATGAGGIVACGKEFHALLNSSTGILQADLQLNQ